MPSRSWQRQKYPKMIKGLEDDLQKLTDKYVKDIDALIDSKSKEIMTV